jgi:hypothetical protein
LTDAELAVRDAGSKGGLRVGIQESVETLHLDRKEHLP